MSDYSDVEFCLVSKELLEDRLVSAKAKAIIWFITIMEMNQDTIIQSVLPRPKMESAKSL